MRRVLALPLFRRLMLGYAIDQLALTMAPLALSVLVYRRTGSALGAAGFFICADVLPGLLSPPVVARLDRSPWRSTIAALYGSQTILFLLLVWLVDHFTLVPVLVATVAAGVAGSSARALVGAAQSSVLRPRGLLRDGNAVINVIFSTIFFVGPLLGGAVVATGGTIAALVACSALLAIVGAVLALTRPPAATSAEDDGAAPGWGRLRAGLRAFMSDRIIARLLGMQVVGLVFFSLTIPVEVVYAQHTLRAGPSGYGTLLAVWGGGALLGSAAYARWHHASTARLLSGSSLALVVGFGIMAIAGTLPIALIGDAIGGIGNGIWAISIRTGIQETAEDEWMALVLSVSNSTAMIAPGLGIAAGGIIATLAGARTAFGVGAVAALGFALAALLVLRRPPAPVGGHSSPAPAPVSETDRTLV